MRKRLFICILAMTALLSSITVQAGSSKSAESFVARFYSELLDREADWDGQAYWSDMLTSGAATAADVAGDFIFGAEFVMQANDNEEFIGRLYRTFFGREADFSGKFYWLDLLDKGATRRSVAAEFINSDEFEMICRDYGITAGKLDLTSAADQNIKLTMYVHRCYAETLGRPADEHGLEYWTGMILSGKRSAQDVARNVLFSAEFEMKNLSREEYIKVLYRIFMGRSSDDEGLAYWLGEMNSGKSKFSIYESFAGSIEFKMILESYDLPAASD